MNILFGAIALTLAVPGYAQTAPAEHKMDCCENMKGEKKECCCKDMAKKGHGERGEQHQPKEQGGGGHDGHGEHAH